MIRKILLALLAALVVIQFFRPAKNQSENLGEADISKVYAIPDDVHAMLIAKCYDCHSNNTVYPWYSYIQPVAWWMNDHIIEGKRHLDFSEFKNYPEKRANHKLEEVIEMIAKKEMPIKSYLIAHPETEVTPEEQAAVEKWIASLGVLKESD